MGLGWNESWINKQRLQFWMLIWRNAQNHHLLLQYSQYKNCIFPVTPKAEESLPICYYIFCNTNQQWQTQDVWGAEVNGGLYFTQETKEHYCKSCFVPWKGTLEGTTLSLAQWKGTLVGISLHFFPWKGIPPSQHRGTVDSDWSACRRNAG